MFSLIYSDKGSAYSPVLPYLLSYSDLMYSKRQSNLYFARLLRRICAA